MEETIVAISTAVGEAGIGIVRMSGKDAIQIAKEVFKPVRNKSIDINDSRKMIYGHIYDGKKIVDEVLACFMYAPKTYTREDMVEIYTHGGMISVKSVFDLLIKKGARISQRGEFTKRAFLNGRLDLTQAEAVIDLIKAKSKQGYDIAIDQLEGSLASKISSIREDILKSLAYIEVSINFEEDGQDELERYSLIEDIEKVEKEILKLKESSGRGKIVKDGIKTAIIGKPNVGKSSLLNRLLRENRAIVTDIPGTTRDVIKEYVDIGGIFLNITDTAGIRETSDEVEKIGVERSKKELENADLILCIIDASKPLNDEDKCVLELIKDKKAIILLNKIDKKQVLKEKDFKKYSKHIIKSSMINEIGIKELEDMIKEMFFKDDIKIKDSAVITNVRHENIVLKAYKYINNAKKDILENVPIDCVEVDIRNAYEILGEITGETVGEDIIDKIFSEFCIGK